MVVARLQGDVKVGAPCFVTRIPQCVHFSVRAAHILMIAPPDDGVPLDDDGPDHRVGAGAAGAFGG
jgi:hypothetical protein